MIKFGLREPIKARDVRKPWCCRMESSNDDTADLATYGLIGAACKRQMELALHVIAHQDTDID